MASPPRALDHEAMTAAVADGLNKYGIEENQLQAWASPHESCILILILLRQVSLFEALASRSSSSRLAQIHGNSLHVVLHETPEKSRFSRFRCLEGWRISVGGCMQEQPCSKSSQNERMPTSQTRIMLVLAPPGAIYAVFRKRLLTLAFYKHTLECSVL